MNLLNKMTDLCVAICVRVESKHAGSTFPPLVYICTSIYEQRVYQFIEETKKIHYHLNFNTWAMCMSVFFFFFKMSPE